MRKVLCTVLSLILCLSCLTACAAAEEAATGNAGMEMILQIGNPMMTVNGVQKEVDPGRGTVPVVVNDRTLVPVRAIIEEMGGTVSWNEETQTAGLAYGSDEIRLTIGSETACLNNEAYTLDVAPMTINDRTMLPIRFIAESFQFLVDWNEEQQMITITSNAQMDASSETPSAVPAPVKPEASYQPTLHIQVGETSFTATFVDNSSTEALKELLAEGPLTIDMSDYGNFEKVGSLGTTLPRNDEPITTEPGDLILYQGNSFVIYYDTNSWNFTRLGKINNATQAELKEALGDGDVSVTLSIE